MLELTDPQIQFLDSLDCSFEISIHAADQQGYQRMLREAMALRTMTPAQLEELYAQYALAIVRGGAE